MKKKIYLLLLAAFAAVAILGCTQTPPSDAGGTATNTTEHHDDHEGHDHGEQAHQVAATPSGDTVEVSAEGTKFDPPVAVENMPHGAWACVMDGTVHYAAMEKGDGECPVCGMNLAQQGAEAPK